MEIDENMADLLAEVRQQGGPENVEVIGTDDAAYIREALGEALQIRHGLPEAAVESMDIGALAAPFAVGVPDDGDQTTLAETLAQHPETGGESAADLAEAEQEADEPQGYDALSAEQQAEVRDRLERAEKFGHRLPEHAESLRAEAAEIVGVESADEIDISLD